MLVSRGDVFRRGYVQKVLPYGFIIGLAFTMACADQPPDSVDHDQSEVIGGWGTDVTLEATVADVHEALLSGRTSCQRLAIQYAIRILRFNPDLRAIERFQPGLLARARALDAAQRTSGLVGPLHCIPTVVKANTDREGYPTTGGSPLFAQTRAAQDAEYLTRLKAAGALILGTAAMDELAVSDSGNDRVSGQIRLPYDGARSPGGSSGGTAAALSANLTLLGTGSDTCGSVRWPAAWNGIVGLRPTIGWVSQAGIMGGSETLDTAGPMARTVKDVAHLLQAMATPGPAGPQDFVSGLDAASLAGRRIGVWQSWAGVDAEGRPATYSTTGQDPEADAILAASKSTLQAGGAELIDVHLDGYTDVNAWLFPIFFHEFDEGISRYLSTLGASPVTNAAQIAASAQVGPWIQTLFGMFADPNLGTHTPAYQQARSTQAAVTAYVRQVMTDQNLDALVYLSRPDGAAPPIPSEVGLPDVGNGHLSCGTGGPAIVVPAGLTTTGLPVGIELYALPGQDADLLQMAAAFERLQPARVPPPQFTR